MLPCPYTKSIACVPFWIMWYLCYKNRGEAQRYAILFTRQWHILTLQLKKPIENIQGEGKKADNIAISYQLSFLSETDFNLLSHIICHWRGHQTSPTVVILTLSQRTNFRLLQNEKGCGRQFQIWWKWQKVLQKTRNHCRKRRNCSLRAISPFPTVFSKDLYCRHVKTGLVWERVKRQTGSEIAIYIHSFLLYYSDTQSVSSLFL